MKLLALTLVTIFTTTSLYANECSKKITEDKVNEVCKQISTKGAAIKSEWPQALLFKNCGDNYIWVQDMSSEIKMVMHPVKQRLNDQAIGKQLDENKFALFAEFDKAAKAKSAGAWVDYVWAKPGLHLLKCVNYLPESHGLQDLVFGKRISSRYQVDIK
jgi:signal transduction histidine kinase